MECKFCHQTIYQPTGENNWVHSRTGESMCGIRYAAPRTWDSEDWSEFWAGFNAKGTETGTTCNHRTAGLLPERDGTLEIIEFDYCPKCGVKL